VFYRNMSVSTKDMDEDGSYPWVMLEATEGVKAK
jgi:hypothetical protein